MYALNQAAQHMLQDTPTLRAVVNASTIRSKQQHKVAHGLLSAIHPPVTMQCRDNSACRMAALVDEESAAHTGQHTVRQH
jgi:hypothetical protein